MSDALAPPPDRAEQVLHYVRTWRKGCGTASLFGLK